MKEKYSDVLWGVCENLMRSHGKRRVKERKPCKKKKRKWKHLVWEIYHFEGRFIPERRT